jgi:hypothetical protein
LRVDESKLPAPAHPGKSEDGSKCGTDLFTRNISKSRTDPFTDPFTFTVGWLKQGHYSNHHNMDVVVLLRYGWPYLNDARKEAAAGEIRKMLRWCLSESLQKDGSFKPQDGDDSVEERTYFAVAFLSRVGFFDQSKRFWTTEDFPESEPIRRKIIEYIGKHQDSGGAGGGYYRDALDELTLKAKAAGE